MARKKFCTITAKDITVEAGDKRLVVHLDTGRRQEIIDFATALFQALAYARGIDITLGVQKRVKKGALKLTVSSHR